MKSAAGFWARAPLRTAFGGRFRAPVAFALGALVVAAPTPTMGTSQTSAESLQRFDGRVECLLAETVLQEPEAPCNQVGAPFALRTLDDEVFTFVDGDPQAEMFVDPRVRAQPLRLDGWVRDHNRLELNAVYSMKDGVPHHVHYRCDVCDITATAPGPCWCCNAPFELRESPPPEVPAR